MSFSSVWTLQIVPFNHSVGLERGKVRGTSQRKSTAKSTEKGPVREGVDTKPKSLNFDLSSSRKPEWFERRE